MSFSIDMLFATRLSQEKLNSNQTGIVSESGLIFLYIVILY